MLEGEFRLTWEPNSSFPFGFTIAVWQGRYRKYSAHVEAAGQPLDRVENAAKELGLDKAGLTEAVASWAVMTVERTMYAR
jgi:hypothetical protein